MAALTGRVVLAALAAVLLACTPCFGTFHPSLPCTALHKVAATDTCSRIVSTAGLFLTDFLTLNPTLKASCTNLLDFTSVCVSGTPPTCGTKGYIDRDSLFTGPNPQFVGRTSSYLGGTRLSWAASSVTGRFSGASIVTFLIRPISEDVLYTDLALNIYVDTNLAVSRLALAQTQTSFSIRLVDKGIHTVELVKLQSSEAGEVVFYGFTTDGVFLPTRAPSTRYMEFVGDSITVGGNILPDKQHPCTIYGDLNYEDVTATAGYLTAQAFQSDISVIAVSGKGVAFAAGRRTGNMTYMYTLQSGRATTPYHAGREADVVVVNLGTNDMQGVNSSGNTVTIKGITVQALTETEFQAAYLKLVKEIRSNNPTAWLVLIVGPMFSHAKPPAVDILAIQEAWVQGVVAKLTGTLTGANPVKGMDQRVRYMEYPTVLPPNKTTGFTVIHPNWITNKYFMAPQLQAFVEGLTGWST